MTLFTLPLSWQNGRISVSSTSFPQTAGQSTNRKRRRSSPLSSQSSPEPRSPSTALAPQDSTFPSHSSPAPSSTNFDYVNSNPLSLNDDEARQYRAAGLEFDKELPGKTYSGFPYKSLPWEAGLTTDDEDRQDSKAGSGNVLAIKRGSKASHLKVRHLSVLTTILQRCLAEGDMARASKAWALLLRAQVGGRAADLRSTGYWSLGAELLIRNSEKPSEDDTLDSTATGNEGINTKHDMNQEPSPAEETEQADLQDSDAMPWGTAEGIGRAKDYYARLILQHPYKRQYSSAISALDFWPAMLSCEIYGIQIAQYQSLHQLNVHHSDTNSDSASSNEDSESDTNTDNSSRNGLSNREEEEYFARSEKRESHAMQRRLRRIWKKRETVRIQARTAAEKVAARMDDLMSTPPFADSHVLHRLRGYLSLYIGDLSVPTSCGPKIEGELENPSARARRSEAERGEVVKEEMRKVARKHFDMARQRGGSGPDLEAMETTLGYEEHPH